MRDAAEASSRSAQGLPRNELLKTNKYFTPQPQKMAGLVSYGNSDEENETENRSPAVDTNKSTPAKISANGTHGDDRSNGIDPAARSNISNRPIVEPNAPLLGPTLADADVTELIDEDPRMGSQSPFSANRALLRDLTLPSLPSYDIPPSPPVSPNESTNAKFKHFLELKKQGVHFNEKLANSSALKNPSLMQKLMDFSSIDEAGQYETTLPKELWNPGDFPAQAYKEELSKSQQKILKKTEDQKARRQRENVEFVSASTLVESTSRSGTSGHTTRPIQKSAAERVMAGLERGRSGSPQVQGTKRKTRFD